MGSEYLGVIILGVVVAGFLITMLVLSSVLGPKHKTHTKQLPFECGSVSIGDVQHQRFNVRFYLVAMLFILFDIEVIFLYPWAVVLKEQGWPVYWAMVLFFIPLVVGFIYEWKKGYLNWNDRAAS